MLTRFRAVQPRTPVPISGMGRVFVCLSSSKDPDLLPATRNPLFDGYQRHSSFPGPPTGVFHDVSSTVPSVHPFVSP